MNTLPAAVKAKMDYYASGERVKYLMTRGGLEFLARLKESYADAYLEYVAYISASRVNG